jgi:glycosyltransferase involved in cell wall biosynthesis
MALYQANSAKSKVLYVITKSNWGGAQRYVYELATSLPKDKFDVEVAFGGTGDKDGKPGLLSFKLHGAGIKTVFIENLQRDVGYLKELSVLFSLIKLFRKEKPDIVHLNSSKIGGIGSLAARIAGVKKITFTVHGWAFDEERPHRQKNLIKLASCLTAIFCTDIIAISKKIEDQTRHLPTAHAKTSLIYNGVDQESERYILPRSESRQKFDIRENVFVIGTIGELTKNKGHEYLIDAVAKLKLKHPNSTFALLMIGNGEDEKKLRHLAASLDISNDVIFAGFRENASQYLKAFDLFVLPSIKEGLPFVILEAGLARLPIIATQVGSIPEIITHEENGLLVPPKSASDIASAIEEMITRPDLRSKLAENLYKTVTEKFDLQEMIEKTTEVYKN